MFRKIVLVTLAIVVGLPLLAIAGFLGMASYEMDKYRKGDFPFADASSFASGNLTITLERFNAHPFLAEYQRFITVAVAGGQSTRREIEMDSGGGGRIDICRTSDGDLFLRDNLLARIMVSADGAIRELENASIWRILPDGGREAVKSRDPQPDCKEPVGRFDKRSRNEYGFIPS